LPLEDKTGDTSVLERGRGDNCNGTEVEDTLGHGRLTLTFDGMVGAVVSDKIESMESRRAPANEESRDRQVDASKRKEKSVKVPPGSVTGDNLEDGGISGK
jgi:hypothetical protein